MFLCFPSDLESRGVDTDFLLSGPKARELVMGFPVMREYARRIHDAYFPDYERWDE